MFDADIGFFHVRALEVRPWMRMTVVAALSLRPPIENLYVDSHPAGPFGGAAACAAIAAAKASAAAAPILRNAFMLPPCCCRICSGHTIPLPGRDRQRARRWS